MRARTTLGLACSALLSAAGGGACGGVAGADAPCPDSGVSGSGSDRGSGSGDAAPLCSVSLTFYGMEPVGSAAPTCEVDATLFFPPAADVPTGGLAPRFWAAFSDAAGSTLFVGVGSDGSPDDLRWGSASHAVILGVDGLACGPVSVAVTLAGVGACLGSGSPPP